MDTRPNNQNNDGAPLEVVEFELSLNSQDIAESGFEAAVRHAADKADGNFLFLMPAHMIEDCQRVAAVSVGRGEDQSTVLVLLQDDGRSFRMENAEESANPFAGMALSYGGLLRHLKELPDSIAA
ncbi:hypothetical protein ABGN05_25900 [Aquibium sp. LZ166]|uniref:Uncharacterized protein n=1 Tax=Aquibium pacificus TaxID=3153579 RepID=A0ABV3SQK6_9HYPH